MGSHFHDWIDYSGVAFSIELLEWGRTFSDFLGQFFISTVSIRTRMFVLQMKPVKCFSFNLKNGSIHKNKVTKLRSRKLHICPKVFGFIGVLVGRPFQILLRKS